MKFFLKKKKIFLSQFLLVGFAFAYKILISNSLRFVGAKTEIHFRKS